MKVAEWGNSLAVRLPRQVVKDAGFQKGDDIRISVRADGVVEIIRNDDELRRERAMQRIRELARPLPADWRFDRDEANAR